MLRGGFFRHLKPPAGQVPDEKTIDGMCRIEIRVSMDRNAGSLRKPYEFGSQLRSWTAGDTWTVTFVLTEECNLRCKYCYLCGKNNRNRMELETAKKAIDLILDQSHLHDSIIVEFIGGEPFLEIDLMEAITEYWKFHLYTLGHKWFGNYRFSISTNGILYHTPSVQNWIRKNYETVSVGITIDGTQAKHDATRVYPDGRGSYQDVVRNVPLWLTQYRSSGTKATFSPQCIPHLTESILHLWSLGIREIAANCVFEDVWLDSDVQAFEEQLVSLADVVLQEDLWDKYNCTFFSDYIGHALAPTENANWCGAGKMLAIGTDGCLYPCVRFLQYALAQKPARHCGSVYTGLDNDVRRAFHALSRYSQSPPQCIQCGIASGCAWCQGCNYDAADTATIFQRSTGLCELHKARVRANQYYWRRLKEEKGIERVALDWERQCQM